MAGKYPSENGVDMTFTGQMRFPGDVMAQFDCSFQAAGRAFMEIVGTDGSLEIPSPFKPGRNERLDLHVGDAASKITIKGTDLYAGEVEDLADAVLNGAQPRVSLANSRGNIATIVALLESARTGKPVRL